MNEVINVSTSEQTHIPHAPTLPGNACIQRKAIPSICDWQSDRKPFTSELYKIILFKRDLNRSLKRSNQHFLVKMHIYIVCPLKTTISDLWSLSNSFFIEHLETFEVSTTTNLSPVIKYIGLFTMPPNTKPNPHIILAWNRVICFLKGVKFSDVFSLSCSHPHRIPSVMPQGTYCHRNCMHFPRDHSPNLLSNICNQVPRSLEAM